MIERRYEARHAALHQGSRLEWITIVWNLGEFFITVSLGIAAGSLALMAFGLDSLIEVFASLVVVRYINRHESPGQASKALRLVALSFLLLAGYLFAAGVRTLVLAEHARDSWLGVAYLAVAATGMFVLCALKYRLAARSGSAPLRAEATLTLVDGILASCILAALLITAWTPLWWVDPVAGLAVAVVGLLEARSALREARSLATTGDDLRVGDLPVED